jgi:hypothetical protein
MRHNDDFIQQLEGYLEEFDGMTPLPDHVRDGIRAALPSARQVQPRPGPGRVFTMLSDTSMVARLGLGAAAIVIVLIVGGAILNSGRSEGVVAGGPTPTPTATNAPTTAPTVAPSDGLQPPPLDAASAVPCDTDVAGCIKAGTYRLSGAPGVWPATVSIDVPAGWWEWKAGTGWDAVILADANGDDSGWGVMFYTVGDVARDPCDLTKGWIPAAQVDTPQQLAAAMAAWPSFTSTNPQPMTIDGHSALKFEVRSTAKASCAATGHVGHTASGDAVDVYALVDPNGAHDPVTVEIIDTGNGLIVIRATDFPQTSPYEVGSGRSPDPTFHAGDQADLHAILDSIRITALPAAS